MTRTAKLSCICGQVHVEVQGAPIVSVGCCCSSCRAAGSRMQALPAARPVLAASGATPLVLYREDRVRFLGGAVRLRELRLTPGAPTRQVVGAAATRRSSSTSRKATGLAFMAASGLWPRGLRSGCGP